MAPRPPLNDARRSPLPARLLDGFLDHWLLTLFLFAVPLAPARVSGQEAMPLSEEFLEFLGGWETASGDWIDPAELAALMPAENAQDESDSDEEN